LAIGSCALSDKFKAKETYKLNLKKTQKSPLANKSRFSPRKLKNKEKKVKEGKLGFLSF
jgi:hypothetical protein